MNRLLKYTLGLIFLLAFMSVEAKETPRKDKRKKNNTTTTYRDQCQKAKAQIDMDINNVRAKLLTGGDLWWDGTNGKYIVPKPKPGSDAPEVSSLYAGGVWIGGKDLGNNLKIAASTFPRSNSVDYYTGPLDPVTGETELQICQDWDRFFEVTGEEIDIHLNNYNKGNYDCSSIPAGVKYWPARGNPYFTEKYDFALPNTGQGLAGFHDSDLDGFYDPCLGDYPIIEIRGCVDPIYADDMFFWIYNDKGGPHTETFGKPIQMEVQVQSFAFVSNDEINDMTFYRYKLINRATEDIKDTYFAMWIDPDLGCSTDDYVGCDTTKVPRLNKKTKEIEMVGRDLMYVYNEDAVDGTTGSSCSGVPTYAFDVPILGVDYFRGPLVPYTWHTVNDEQVLIRTELGEEPDTTLEVGMSSFVYYNNRASGNNPAGTLDPENADEYYNYLLGLWKDETPFTYGGTGYNPGSVDSTKFATPSDPNATSSGNGRDPWSMCSESLPAGDRRTLQVTGPLLLKPGAKNELIIGAVWVPHIDYPCPDLSKLLYADGLAQALFDNCFDRLEGPDAPDMCGIELDKELVLVLTNDTTELNNNAYEQYQEVDIFSENIDGDSLYRFEGYKIYQLADENVSVQELDDIDRAILVRQVDLRNGVNTIYNWTSISNPNGADDIWIYNTEVEGADKGLNHTFQITADAFAQGDGRLINHKKYHFLVLAYAHSRLGDFDPKDPQVGQRKPYLAGNFNIKVLTLIPRPIVYENLRTKYGDGPEITRISGVGVGKNIVNLKEGTHEMILNGEITDGVLVYEPGAGPIDIKVYDPLNVKDGKYRLEILGDFNGFSSVCQLAPGATWKLTNLETEEVILSEHSLDDFNEQVLGELGFAISIGQTPDVGTDPEEVGNGGLSAEIVYEDPEGDNWFLGLPDSEQSTSPVFDYIENGEGTENYKFDPNVELSRIGDGFFTPFYMNKYIATPTGPIWFTPGFTTNHFLVQKYSKITDLNNVDIVMTSDKSKWSRCVVVERATSDYKNTGHNGIGLSGEFFPRDSESIDKDGNPDGTGKGMSYFPGYAIDVETGERLNIFFGENSTYNSEYSNAFQDSIPLGEDMIFNPSSQVIISATETDNQFSHWNLIVGGQHNIYVTRQNYDECAEIYEKLKSGGPVNKGKALGLVTWQAVPIVAPDMKMRSIADGLIPNDVTIKMRVSNPYNRERIVQIGKKTCVTKEENPVYEFELKGIESLELEKEEYEGALENVNVVPNPYYGFSAYEFTQYSTVVKITNVPAKATVTIYSLDGKFIKQFKRDEIELPCDDSGTAGVPTHQINPDIEWNLKNSKGIPVASGVYLIHVIAPELGEERTIKWFGVGRKFDPSGL